MIQSIMVRINNYFAYTLILCGNRVSYASMELLMELILVDAILSDSLPLAYTHANTLFNVLFQSSNSIKPKCKTKCITLNHIFYSILTAAFHTAKGLFL